MSQISPVWGLLISGTILCVVVWVNIIAPRIRRYRLRYPSEAAFIVKENGKLKKAKELRVPAASEASIELEHEPKLKFESEEISFGFFGEVGEKPEPTSYFNDFVREGTSKSGSPGNNPAHFVDRKANYHITRKQVFTPGNSYTLGFKLATAKRGRYPVRWYYFTDEGEGRVGKDLTLIVE